MAIGRGQKSSRQDASTNSFVATWGTNPSAGSKVIVWFWGSFTVDPTSVKDNGSPQRTFTKDAVHIDSTNGDGIWIFRADNVQPTASAYTVTVATGSSNTGSVGGLEYTGVASGAPVATNTNSGTGTAVSSGAVTDASSDLYVAGYVDDANGADTITVGGGFTDQFNLDSGATFDEGAGSDKINATGSQTASWTLQFSRHWASCIAVYQPVATGGAAPRRPAAALYAVKRSSYLPR